MTDETQSSAKLPNINQEERDWLTVMLAFFKPNKVYEPFLYEFPRLAEYADKHDISDEALKTLIIDRFYEMKKRKNRTTSEVMSAIERVKGSVIGVLTNEVIFAHFMPMEMLLKMRNMVFDAAMNFESSSFAKEDPTLKDYLTVLDKYIRIITHLRKANIDVEKFLLSTKIARQEEIVQVQAKQMQSPSDFDWNDESWLEGGEDE